MMRKPTRIHPTVCFLFGCSLLLVWGCAKPETDIGLGLQPANNVLPSGSDTVTVVFETVAEDSLETDELSTGLLGQVYLPGMTYLRAGLVTQLRLSATDVDFGNSPVADSAFLQLRYADGSYGVQRPQLFSVQPLSDSLSLDSSYYSNYVPSTTGQEWVKEGAGPWTMDAYNPSFAGGDTVPPQLLLPLRTEIVQGFLDLDSTVFDNNSSWFEVVPGISVSSLQGGSGVAALDINSGLSVLRIHYHNDSDTTFYDFLVSPLSARVNVFDHHFTGELSALQGIDAEASLPGDQQALVISASGCKTRVRFPYLEAFQDSLGEAPLVLKAELVVPVKSEWGTKPFSLQDQLFVLQENGAGGFGATTDQSTPIAVGGNYNPSRDAYVFNLTSTVQEYMKGERNGRDLFLVSSRAGVSVAGVVLHGPQSDRPAQLNLTIAP